jgi:hypothetical protein
MLGALILVVMTGVARADTIQVKMEKLGFVPAEITAYVGERSSGSIPTSLCSATARGSVKAEYLYVNFNNQTIVPGTFTLIENVVRGGVNYRL